VSLTSSGLMYLLAALAAGLLLTIIIDWSRLAGRNLRSVAERAVSLVGLQLVVLALIFVVVNRAGGFYSSWSDLFGLDNAGNTVIGSDSARASGFQPVVLFSRKPVTVPGSQAAGGVLETVTFNGQLSGISVPGLVFLPAGYRAAAHYPVIVEISNDLTSASSSYGAARLAQSAARQIALGKLEPVIIVMVPASVSGADQGCLDVPPQTNPATGQDSPAIMAATFFTQDLPAAAQAEYGASTNSAQWSLLGDSSGGYCALQLAMTSSWVFSTAVAPAGTYAGPPGMAASADSRQLRQQDNLYWLLQNQPMQPVSILFTTAGSRADGAGLFSAAARPPMHVSRLAVGGGSWPLAAVLDWIGAAIAPRAQHAPPGLG
jgi:enterochelin esterase-like enzyme